MKFQISHLQRGTEVRDDGGAGGLPSNGEGSGSQYVIKSLVYLFITDNISNYDSVLTISTMYRCYHFL